MATPNTENSASSDKPEKVARPSKPVAAGAIEERLGAIEDQLEALNKGQGEISDTLSAISRKLGVRRARAQVAAAVEACVRVIVEAVIERGPNGRPLRLSRGDVRSGAVAEWLLKHHAKKVEPFPKEQG